MQVTQRSPSFDPFLSAPFVGHFQRRVLTRTRIPVTLDYLFGQKEPRGNAKNASFSPKRT